MQYVDVNAYVNVCNIHMLMHGMYNNNNDKMYRFTFQEKKTIIRMLPNIDLEIIKV